MDPIASMVLVAGETAVIQSPATTKAYDPSSSTDYAPNAPVGSNVKGVPEGAMVLQTGETAAFTMQAASKPANLLPEGSTLVWRSITWKIVRYRERRWLGKINGYTLFLAT